ncbi:hypothetical protein [Staphylococcus delphini]|uniref:spr1630 family ClpXP-sensitive toxin n=1 Tax=Staphylococcus delphini TaxID=53344 RepID=UPI0023B25B95|nr:hypothetical protein [Staphylococcus delphini]MDE9828771.1 hypothetical protein [Staphylococcus delphini]
MSQFDYQLKLSIVKGIIAGYKDYVKVRNEAHKKLKVSNGYAFVKANHIDHHVALNTEKFVENTKRSAGPSWKFLLFSPTDKHQEKVFHFVVVNRRTFNKDKVNKGRSLVQNSGEPPEKKYLTELIELNRGVDFEKLSQSLHVNHQLNADKMLFDMINNDSNDKIKFIMITYDVDNISKMLKEIKVWIPNPITYSAIEFLDLTEEMNDVIKNDEHYQINEEEIEVLKQDREYVEWIDTEVFGFEIEEIKESDL